MENSSYSFFRLLLILSFFQGVFRIVGVDVSYTKYIIEFLIFALALKVLSFGRINKTKVLFPFLLASATIIASTLYNNDFTMGSFTFYRPLLNSFFVYMVFLNLELTSKQVVGIFKLISTLVVIQVIASVIKYFLIGKGENWIGTMSYSAGGLNTYFTLIVSSYALGMYLNYKKSRKYILLILGSIFLAWVGRKKGVYFYLVLTFGIIYILHNFTYLKKRINLMKISLVMIISLLVVYLGVILTPPLNPERKVGGSFDIEYLEKFMTEYSYYSQKRDAYAGRIGGNILLTKEFLGESEEEWINKNKINEYTYLFGFGPSSFHLDNYLTKNENLNTYNRLIPTGYLRTVFSTGFIGELGFIVFYAFFLVKLYREYKNDNQYYTPFGLAILLGTLTSFILVFIDHYTYLYHYNSVVVYIIHFFFAGILLKNKPYKIIKSYEQK